MKGKFQIDDCFKITGRGLVLTGEVIEGELEQGDRLELIVEGQKIERVVAGIDIPRNPSSKKDLLGVLVKCSNEAEIDQIRALDLKGVELHILYEKSNNAKRGIFSYHLLHTPVLPSIKRILVNPIAKNTAGLVHAEFMTAMTLGSPVFSTSRVLIGKVAVFMQWDNEESLEHYLKTDRFGKVLADGWHVRLSFVREWGSFTGFKIPKEKDNLESPDSPVVAVTIARMKPLAVPRFIHWGRPVEKLVRDHPGTTLSLASIKFPNTVSTFSIWKTAKEMTDMVHGHSKVERPKRHADAMKERERKNFHFEFTTLRFKPLGEYGSWKGRSNWIPMPKSQVE